MFLGQRARLNDHPTQGSTASNNDTIDEREAPRAAAIARRDVRKGVESISPERSMGCILHGPNGLLHETRAELNGARRPSPATDMHDGSWAVIMWAFWKKTWLGHRPD